MLHIVHLTTVHVPFDTRIFHKECKTLAAAGYRVTLLATHPRCEIVDGVEVMPLPHHDRRAGRMLLGSWAALRAAHRLHADLYHLHDPELLPVGLLVKWTTRARMVYDAHENYAKQLASRTWMAPLLRRVLPKFAGVVERLSVRVFDAVVCATEHIAANLHTSKTIVVKNYPLLEMVTRLDTTHPGAESKDTRPAVSLPDAADSQRLIYTGGWSPDRGVFQLVQALGYVKTPGCRLSVLGRCVDKRLRDEAAELPGFAQVDDLGMLPYDELYQTMQVAAVGMVCNQPRHDFDRSQPNKLFEYMSAGLPVIASNFPLWKQVVEGSSCGLTVDPTDPREIASAIDKILADPDARGRMGQNGRQAVLTTYNWCTEGQKLLNLYKELLH